MVVLMAGITMAGIITVGTMVGIMVFVDLIRLTIGMDSTIGDRNLILVGTTGMVGTLE